MAGDKEETKILEHKTNFSGSLELVRSNPLVSITVSVIRHRDLARGKWHVVHQLHSVLYRPDGGVLHTFDAEGPISILAPNLYRILDMAGYSRPTEPTEPKVRHSKRSRV